MHDDRHSKAGAWVVLGVLLLGGTLAVLATLFRVDGPFTREPERASILLISIDNLRADHLGCYGYDRNTSPNIDRLAERSLVFTDTMSPSNWTLPAHASLLTGLRPRRHGVIDHDHSLGPSTATVAEYVRAAGYDTAAFVSHDNVSHVHGLNRGFDVWELEHDPPPDRWCDRVLEYFGARSSDAPPAFVFLHLFTVHWPFVPEPPFDQQFDPGYEGPADGGAAWVSRFIAEVRTPGEERDFEHVKALYDGEIATVDRALGRMFDALQESGQLEGMTVIVTSDHGEAFREHGVFGHGFSMFQEELQVPLIVKLPEPPGRPGRQATMDRPASLLDLAPTLLDLAKADRIAGLEGASLVLPVKKDHRRLLVSESNLHHIQMDFDRVTLRYGDMKYVFAPRVLRYDAEYEEAIFDLAVDPGETRNLVQDRPELAAEFRRMLRTRGRYEIQDAVALVWGPDCPEGMEILLETDALEVVVYPARTATRQGEAGIERYDFQLEDLEPQGLAEDATLEVSGPDLGEVDPRADLPAGSVRVGRVPVLRYAGPAAETGRTTLTSEVRARLEKTGYILPLDVEPGYPVPVREIPDTNKRRLQAIRGIPETRSGGVIIQVFPPDSSVRIQVRGRSAGLEVEVVRN